MFRATTKTDKKTSGLMYLWFFFLRPVHILRSFFAWSLLLWRIYIILIYKLQRCKDVNMNERYTLIVLKHWLWSTGIEKSIVHWLPSLFWLPASEYAWREKRILLENNWYEHQYNICILFHLSLFYYERRGVQKRNSSEAFRRILTNRRWRLYNKQPKNSVVKS